MIRNRSQFGEYNLYAQCLFFGASVQTVRSQFVTSRSMPEAQAYDSFISCIESKINPLGILMEYLNDFEIFGSYII